MKATASNLNLRKNVAAAILSFMVNSGLVFLSYRLLILKGGLEAVGLWSTLFAWTSLIRIGDVGMASASLRFAALCDPQRDREKLQKYIETGILTNAALFFILTVIGYVTLSLALPHLVRDDLLESAQKIVPLMMASFYFMNMSGVVSGSMQGLHLGYIASQLSVGGSIVQIILVILLVPLYSLEGLAIAQIGQYVLMLTIGWWYVRKSAGIANILPLKFSYRSFREMLSFSLKAQVANIANGLFEPTAKIMVGHFGGLPTLGVFELAYKTVTTSRSLPASGVNATLPAMTKLLSEDRLRAKALYGNVARRNMFVTSAMFVLLTAASPIIALIWIGHIDYLYVIYVGTLCFGFLGNSLGAPAYLLGAASGQMTNVIITAGSSLGTLVLVGAIAGVTFGGNGVIITVACTLCLAGIVIKRLNERFLEDALSPGAVAELGGVQ
ncbi:oligosaccharide flippase family protein [Oryzifoliimicrobium ureilyticus]|uniref:oligosaccharide flippase family protein n=1 Tax=Oryzifoliimicrobium ureilyticus TaxID=3113724 RepID=UPI0030764AE3